jgi:peptide chain release factor subunit 1
MRSAATGWGTELDVVWPVPDRAVVGPRPYIRPLLSALSRAGPYVVAVVNRRHAWMFRVDGHTIETINRLVGAGVRDPSYAGWAGYQEYGVRQRAWELARRHYRTTASTLAAVSQQVCRDIVVGGHEATIGEFVAELPDWLRQRVTGTFVVDPHTMTLGELRVRSERARMDWRVDHERRLRTELAEWESGGSAVSGLAPSAQAVSRSQAELLVVAGEDVAPGYVCDQCGELRVEDDKCPGCGALLRAVSDLVDELMARIVTEHGQVEFVDTGDGAEPQVAARLRPGFARRASQG